MLVPTFIKNYILNSLKPNGDLNSSKLKKNTTQEIDEWFNENNFTVKQVKYLVINNIDAIPLCPVCGNPIHHFENGAKFCSASCSNKSNVTKQKMQESFLKKYGVTSYTKTKEYKQKADAKCLERYGTTSYSKTDEYKEKVRKTNIKKYGTESYSQTDEYKERVKKTNLERYGVDSYSKTNDFKDKVKQTELERYGGHHMLTEHSKQAMKNTSLERYGVDNYSKTEESRKHQSEIWKNKSDGEIAEIVKKSKQTNLERYGVINYAQTNECKERIKNTELERYGGHHMLTDESKQAMKNTCLKKYGVESYSYTDEYIEKSIFTKRRKFFELNKNQLKDKHISILSTEDEYYSNILVRYKCELCNTEFESNKTNVQKVVCPECNRNKGVSVKEKEVLAWIQSIYFGTIIENDRTVLNGKELDIYIPEKKLAIEFNGNYWHSTVIKEIAYHQEKTLDCKKSGVRLIHIFEYDWDFQQAIIKSIIKSALGLYDKRIFARQCIAKEISANDYKYFLDMNHLQGSISSSIRYGLYYQDELVAVIGFGKSRFKKDEMELHRFCCKLNYSIPGAFSKLIKHSNISNFITYVDLAHFSGDGYRKIGFAELSITSPNYKWVSEDNLTVLNRFQTQKHKLAQLLGEDFDQGLTETENMELNGYVQVFDSGNIKMEYKSS